MVTMSLLIYAETVLAGSLSTLFLSRKLKSITLSPNHALAYHDIVLGIREALI